MRLGAGASIDLEPFIILVGSDPWRMLEMYGDRTVENYPVKVLEKSPVSFCSWYPFRLNVSEELMVANARVAAERLKPLGLSINCHFSLLWLNIQLYV